MDIRTSKCDNISEVSVRRSENNAVNIAKIIMAILVVAFHTDAFGDISEEFNFFVKEILCRVPVPTFFAYAGYYLKLKVEKTNDAKKVIHNYVKRLAIVYFAWSLIYFPIQVMNYYANGVTGLTLLLKVLRDFIFVGFKQYWYLLALIIGVVIVCMLKKIFNIRVVFVCCALLYTVCLLANGYYGIYLLVFEEAEMVRTFFGALARVLQTTRNGLFFAPIFIAMGYFFKEKEGHLQKYIILLMSSILFRLIEVFVVSELMLAKGYTMMFSIIPITYLILCITINTKSKCKFATDRRISTLIYLVHTIIAYVVTVFMNNSLLVFILTLIGSIVFAKGFILLSEKYKVLKALY